ncbi:hypothetical protein [Lederbergia lenta]|uniref:Uncharacterized protein n=1 Tax=Lederbergia lenta TaxID=1467 RepID=A0A2X4VQW0_LEDLE|nr:hypothetical protein [Lederbergia lenta]MEC2323527.1 hypothetical protein [Lederbergia lenta]SQI52639.1 Uncharacterised protein [Lederbergia lenta]
MKRRWKNRLLLIIITLFVLGAILTSGKFGLDLLLGGMCGNKIIEQSNSKNERKTAYIFRRDCGAMTGYSYLLSILNQNKQLKNKSGNTFVSDEEFSIEWQNDKSLKVYYNNRVNAYEMDKRVSGVKVEYIGEQ